MQPATPITENKNTLLETMELEALPVLKGALTIYFSKIFSFAITSLIIVALFLAITFGMIYGYGDFEGFSAEGVLNILRQQNYTQFEGKQSLLVIPIAWIFFSWLRTSYLVAANGYFEPSKPLLSSLDKIISFMLIELMSLVILVLGLVIFPILPFIVTKYYISSAVLAAQNEGGINSMLESGEYVEGRMVKTISCSFFINVFIAALMLSIFIVSDFFIKDNLIFWSLNILLFIFIFLPIHACYRFLIFKKLQFLDGELRVEESALQKFWFVFLRLFLFGSAVAVIILTANGKMSGFVSEFIFKIVG